MGKNDKNDGKPVDPRSSMTDRDKFLPRSIHTPKGISIFAAYVAKKEGIKDATKAVARVLEMLELDDGNYSADPTYAKAIENTDERMAEE